MDLSGGARATKLTCDREAVHVVDEVDEAENDDGEPLWPAHGGQARGHGGGDGDARNLHAVGVRAEQLLWRVGLGKPLPAAPTAPTAPALGHRRVVHGSRRSERLVGCLLVF